MIHQQESTPLPHYKVVARVDFGPTLVLGLFILFFVIIKKSIFLFLFIKRKRKKHVSALGEMTS